MLRRIVFCLALLLVADAKGKPSSVCGNQKLFADYDAQYLTSPNWPLRYPGNIDCYYDIAVWQYSQRKHTVILEIKWLEFDVKGLLGSCEDFVAVKINKDNRTNFPFCSDNFPHTIYSAEGGISLHFHSDEKNTGFGFRASFKLVHLLGKPQPHQCSREINGNAPQGVIRSPNWPKLRSPSSCVFHFTLTDNETLLLNIMDFKTRENSSECDVYNDYLELRVSSSNESDFHESCSKFAMSSCKADKKRSVTLKTRSIFLHLNLLKFDRNARGFVAGYMIYKGGSAELKAEGQKEKHVIFHAVFIGAVAGILIGVTIVFVTSLSVSLCMKKGML